MTNCFSVAKINPAPLRSLKQYINSLDNIYMKLPKLLLAIAITVMSASGTRAQFSETIFYDTLTKVSSDGYVHSCLADGKYIYVSGSSFSETSPLPTVTKMDTAGNVIWTATDESDNRFSGNWGFKNSMNSCRSTIKSGNRIFTAAEPRAFALPTTLLHEVWCISDSTGVLLWKLNINKSWIVRLADYSDTSIIAITRTTSASNTFIGIYDYHLIHKQTGALIYSKHFGDAGLSLFNEPNVFVDNNKNILLSWDDTCKKFRDDRLNQLLWTSHIPYNGSLKMINVVTQSDNRYYFSGQNNVRCVDTATGATVWYNQYPSIGYMPGVQSGGDCIPKDILFKDSLLYMTWTSVYVGGVQLTHGFTLTRLNKTNGYMKYMAAYDFTGTPPDPPPSGTSDQLDWPFKICMDENRNIYIVGSYDRAPGQESPGNWGIMRFNSETGQKVYEATITDNPSQRSERSQAKFVTYIDGKLYAVGNLEKPSNPVYARPLFVAFDTSIIFRERYRKGIDATIRYSSSLTAILPVSVTKMALLKKVGRSSVVELRTNNNQLIWSKTFNSAAKFMVPQNMTVMADTGIAASFILYKEDPDLKVVRGVADSLVFVHFDTTGNIRFSHTIKNNPNDTLTAMQVSKDDLGKVNFVYRRKNGPLYNYYGYMLGGTSANLSSIAGSVSYDPDTSVIRLNTLQQYNRDTTVCYQTGNSSPARGWLQSNTQGIFYPNFGFRPVSFFSRIYSSLKLDSVSFFVMGRDSSGQIRGARYNHRLANPLVWSYMPAVNGTLFNADSSSQFLYTIAAGAPTKKLIINKIERSTGAAVWESGRTPIAKTNILPVDFKYNNINRRFTIGGYIIDSTRSGLGSAYFYIVLDSTGTIINDLVRPGFGLGETRINAINVLQNGTNIYGGSHNRSDYGTVGFYNSDCVGNTLVASVSITAPAGNFCIGSPITFTATPVNGGSSPSYEWKVNDITVGTDSPTFTSSTLTNGAQVKVIMTSNGSCLQSSTATSNQITVALQPATTVSVSISGNTTVIQGQSTAITLTLTNGGSTPLYQWQDSTVGHTWQNINGATGSTINYIPVSTGDKLRVLITSSMNCATPVPAASNALSFTVNTITAVDPTPASEAGVIYYPNPTTGTLYIDSLKLSDRWETFVITTLDGRNALGAIDVKNKKQISINLSRLPAGMYIGVLNGRNKARVFLRFEKL